MQNLNWKVVAWVTAGVVVLLLVVAVAVGVKEALEAAGMVGAAAVAAALRNKTDSAKRSLDASDSTVREIQQAPKKAEDAARVRVEKMSDAEKVKKGNDLLGGGK